VSGGFVQFSYEYYRLLFLNINVLEASKVFFRLGQAKFNVDLRAGIWTVSCVCVRLF